MMPAYGAYVHSNALCNDSSGAEETRTPDFLLAKEALYQLSYGPKSGSPLLGRHSRTQAYRCGLSESCKREWALLDSNQRPLPYQGSALTS